MTFDSTPDGDTVTGPDSQRLGLRAPHGDPLLHGPLRPAPPRMPNGDAGDQGAGDPDRGHGAAPNPEDGPGAKAPRGEDDAADTDDTGELTPGAYLLSQLEGENAQDRRRLRWTIAAALIFHAILLLVTLPKLADKPLYVGKPGKVFVMKQVRFERPPAEAKQEQKIPDPKKKKIPIPDPTPDEPEPIIPEDLDIPDIEPTDTDEFFFGIPEGPDPGFGTEGAFTGEAFQVGGGVNAPVAIHKPQPRFTEEARQSRVQGVVILSCVIDAEGDVKNLKVVKGLPLGLAESALETVATWKYKPAYDAQGKKVAVYYHITINFSLQ